MPESNDELKAHQQPLPSTHMYLINSFLSQSTVAEEFRLKFETTRRWLRITYQRQYDRFERFDCQPHQHPEWLAASLQIRYQCEPSVLQPQAVEPLAC